MLKNLRSTIIGLVCGLAGFAMAQTIPLILGPQDLSGLFNSLNQLILTMNSQVFSYITFNKTGSVGELSFLQPVQVSGTSILVVMPGGSARYIQTSATP